ncbi:MAG: hypothetical protein JSC085_001000 [Candidatus Tokpelaia sp. JSC085]|nr:MAG: hypothetical protein JSC085_001000 [Candidatus Tokpelaia sp. JSC085]
MGGSSKRTKSSSDNSGEWHSASGPPSWALPDFQGSLDEARRIYKERKGQGRPELSQGTQDAIGGLNGMPGQWQNPWSSESNLRGVASGAELGINNPEFQKNLQNALGMASGKINSMFAGAGRSGSGANQAVAGRELGNIASQTVQDQYNKDRAAQLHANQQIDQATGNRLSGQGNAWENAIQGSSVQDKWNQQNNQWSELQRWQNAIQQGTIGATEGSGTSTGKQLGSSRTKDSGNPLGDIANIVSGVAGIMYPPAGSAAASKGVGMKSKG